MADAGGHDLERVAAAAAGVEPAQVAQQGRRQHGRAVQARKAARAGARPHTFEFAHTPKRGIFEVTHSNS